jgi:RNA polymerase sigma-70 factor, ECF subfamily
MLIPAPVTLLTDQELQELQPVLLAYALRAIGNAELARDLVQETLLAAVAGHPKFEQRAALRTWCIGILTHKVMDVFRSRRRARLVSADELPAEQLAQPTHECPEQRIDRREALLVLDAALLTLPEMERVAVLLIDVEGWERDDACTRLDVASSHLRVLLHRGRHRLRRALEKAGYDNA